MRSLVFLGMMLLSVVSFAGDKVGNGGGVWACVSSQGQEISKASLVDLYEAREEFGLRTLRTSETEPMNIVQDRMDFVKSNWPEMYAKWNLPLMFVMSNIRYVSAELVVVDDALYRIKPLPASCKRGKWQYMQFANFTHLGQILIQKELWSDEAVAPLDKAALIWHEAIYKWMRERYGDRDSVRTRQIVGILFSDLDILDIKKEVEKVLENSNAPQPNPNPHPKPQPPTIPENEKFICLVRNGLSGWWFSGYGINDVEAKGNSLEACASGGDSYHCDENQIRCEENISAIPNRVCIVKDRLNSKNYTAKGRSEAEAFVKAFTMCTDSGVNSVHCQQMECQ